MLVGSVGAMVLGGMASSEKNPSPGLAFLNFFGCGTIAWLVWSVVNWLLSVASIFVVTDNADTLSAIGDAVGLVREHFGAVMAICTWFGSVHIVAISVASSAVAFPLAFVGIVAGRIGVLRDAPCRFALFCGGGFFVFGKIGVLCVDCGRAGD